MSRLIKKVIFTSNFLPSSKRAFNLLRSSAINDITSSARYASTYKAALVKEFGKPLVIENLKRKSLKKGEVRVEVYCCGINSIDLSNIYGEFDPKPQIPFVPGFEVCGEVVEVAEGEFSSKIKLGQRIIGMSMDTHLGGFAEEIVISARDVWPVDANLSFANGASLINSYATALLALTRRASVEAGQTVLVTGAAGRLGLATLDLAANVYRCKVIAVCSSEEKASIVRDRGAFATVTLSSKKDIATQVRKLTGDAGVPIIIDSVGGDVFQQIVKCAADEGKIIVAGFASKKIPQISGEELMENSISVLGVSLDQYRKKKFEVYREAVSDVIEMCEERLVHPLESKHFPLDKVNEAVEYLNDKESVTKIVLDLR